MKNFSIIKNPMWFMGISLNVTPVFRGLRSSRFCEDMVLYGSA
jgi:hypothetical protein